MGFETPGSVTTENEYVYGALFWCSGYDSSAYKWCDRGDGYWENEQLDSNGDFDRITTLTCGAGKL